MSNKLTQIAQSLYLAFEEYTKLKIAVFPCKDVIPLQQQNMMSSIYTRFQPYFKCYNIQVPTLDITNANRFKFFMSVYDLAVTSVITQFSDFFTSYYGLLKNKDANPNMSVDAIIQLSGAAATAFAIQWRTISDNFPDTTYMLQISNLLLTTDFATQALSARKALVSLTKGSKFNDSRILSTDPPVFSYNESTDVTRVVDYTLNNNEYRFDVIENRIMLNLNLEQDEFVTFEFDMEYAIHATTSDNYIVTNTNDVAFTSAIAKSIAVKCTTAGFGIVSILVSPKCVTSNAFLIDHTGNMMNMNGPIMNYLNSLLPTIDNNEGIDQLMRASFGAAFDDVNLMLRICYSMYQDRYSEYLSAPPTFSALFFYNAFKAGVSPIQFIEMFSADVQNYYAMSIHLV